uniref:G-protein coupled receptors family 1 profile domain-containing protein n=1 Tax=Parascaris univalens TaxID=6257 RepID=A0A915ATK9_PARUN
MKGAIESCRDALSFLKLPYQAHQRAVLVQDYSDEMENCTYRYTGMEESLKLFSLWMDGPVTIAAVILAFFGAHFAIRFLARAAINKELTASLYLLCLSDSLLMSSVFFFYSIEATGQLLLNENLMWQNQSTVRFMHGIASFATTASVCQTNNVVVVMS